MSQICSSKTICLYPYIKVSPLNNEINKSCGKERREKNHFHLNRVYHMTYLSLHPCSFESFPFVTLFTVNIWDCSKCKIAQREANEQTKKQNRRATLCRTIWTCFISIRFQFSAASRSVLSPAKSSPFGWHEETDTVKVTVRAQIVNECIMTCILSYFSAFRVRVHKTGKVFSSRIGN